MLELCEVQKDTNHDTITYHSKQIEEVDTNKISEDESHKKNIEDKSVDGIERYDKETHKQQQDELLNDLFARQSEEEDDHYKTCEEHNEEYNFEFVKRTRRRTRHLRSREDVGYVYRDDTLRRRRRQTSGGGYVRPNTCRYRQDKNGNVKFFMLYERPPDHERTIRNKIRENQGRRMPSR